MIFILSVNIGYSQLFTKKKILNNENFDKPNISWGYFLGMNNYDFNFDYKVNLEDIQTHLQNAQHTMNTYFSILNDKD